MADLGWMAGHVSVVYGPLSNGETTVLFEGLPWEPHPGNILSVYSINASDFYTIHFRVLTKYSILASSPGSLIFSVYATKEQGLGRMLQFPHLSLLTCRPILGNGGKV